jgi:hypothetical protein
MLSSLSLSKCSNSFMTTCAGTTKHGEDDCQPEQMAWVPALSTTSASRLGPS